LNICILIINYNYENYIETNIKDFIKLTRKKIDIIVVDDQSELDLMKLEKKLEPLKVFKTNYMKSNNPNLCQEQAIKFGLSLLKPEHEYVWIVDGDDVVFVSNYVKLNQMLQSHITIFSQPYAVNAINNKKFKVPTRPSRILPWAKNITTSCILIKQSELQDFFKSNFALKDFCWFDIRLQMYLRKKKIVPKFSSLLTTHRLLHSEGASAYWRNRNFIGKIIALNNLINYFLIGWKKWPK
jgi:glycosyltransferase involved in cell wall biosynthesis